MLSIPGWDCASYWEQLSAGMVPEVGCPSCGKGRLRGHGWYRRRIDGKHVRVRRLRCPCCRETHALLPEDLCAYRDLKLAALEEDEDLLERHCKPISYLLPAPLPSFLDSVYATVGSKDPLTRLRHWLWSHFGFFFSGFAGLFRRGRPHRNRRHASTNSWMWCMP